MKRIGYVMGGLLAIVASLAMTPAGGAMAAEGAMELLSERDDGRSNRISLNYRQTRLERVIADLEQRGTGVNIRVKASSLQEERELLDTPVTLELSGVNFDTALRYVADRLKLIINREQMADGVIYLEKVARFTDTFDGVRLGDAIREITRRGEANVVFSPSVATDTPVYLSFIDVPWREALDSVLKAHSCTVLFDADGRIMRIATMEDAEIQFETRSRPLRFVQPEGSHFQPEIVKDDHQTFVGRKGGTTSDVGKSLTQVLDDIKSEKGTITYESRTNTLIIRDTPVKIQEMLKLVDEIDVPPAQVLIETRLMTVDEKPTTKLGVRWGTEGATGEYNGVEGGVDGGSSWDVVWPWGPNNSGPNLGSGNTLLTTGLMDLSKLGFWLQAAATDNSINIVQAPQILVLDNEEASVFIGDVRNYATVQSTQNETSTSTSITEEEILVGVQLMVVPHVCRGTDQVVLEIIPKQTDDPEFQTIVAGNNSLRIPDRMAVKTVHTKMMLHSTETGVIAGLFKEDYREVVQKIPGLWKIPMLGKAFQHKDSQKYRYNTMILVTPTIIPPKHVEEFDKEIENFKNTLLSTLR